MLQEQEVRAPASTQNRARQRHTTTQLRISLLLGAGLTVIFALLEAAILLLLNPSHILSDGMNRFTAFMHLLLSVPAVILSILLLQFLLFSLVAFVLVKPIVVLLYLRRIRSEQEPYERASMPVEMSMNTRRVIAEDEQDAASVSTEEEQAVLLDVVQREDRQQLILGASGSGKTMALRAYQYRASQQPLNAVFKRNRIPIYIPMEHYNLYLKRVQAAPTDEDDTVSQETLLNFLYASDLPGMRLLRPHLFKLGQQGRLLLLCDGLNEIDEDYLSQVCQELVDLARNGANRVVITCRMVDYRRQRELVRLVDEGSAERVVISPLQPEQIAKCIEDYVASQGSQCGTRRDRSCR